MILNIIFKRKLTLKTAYLIFKMSENLKKRSKSDSIGEHLNQSQNEFFSKDQFNNEPKNGKIIKTYVISSSLKSDLSENQLVRIDDGPKKFIKVTESPKGSKSFFDLNEEMPTDDQDNSFLETFVVSMILFEQNFRKIFFKFFFRISPLK